MFIRKPLPFGYESTGVETFFRDLRDPDSRSRPVFAFHKPETLLKWIRQQQTLRYYLQTLPFIGDRQGLRDCQIEAITNLETVIRCRSPSCTDPDGNRQRENIHRRES